MFSPKKALWFIAIIFLLSTLIAVFVFWKSTRGANYVVTSLAALQEKAPQMTIEQCAEETITWFQSCNVMSQLCVDNVPRMMKVCLVHGNKANQCQAYQGRIDHYNFGFEECQLYLNEKTTKRACADVWRTVADYCKAVRATQQPLEDPPPRAEDPQDSPRG